MSIIVVILHCFVLLFQCVTLHYYKANCYMILLHTLWYNYIIHHPWEVCDGDLVWPTLSIIKPCK